MSKKKLLLDMDDDLIDLKIIGIVSSESHLEFVHSLNKSGNFNFERIGDFEIKDSPETRYFIQFKFETPETNEYIILLKSKGNVGFISKELSGLDYIMLIHSENDNFVETVKDMLNSQKTVMMSVILSGKSISEKLKRLLNN
jgi:hypothetical protein